MGKDERRMHVLVREPFRVDAPSIKQWCEERAELIMMIALPMGEAHTQRRSEMSLSA